MTIRNAFDSELRTYAMNTASDNDVDYQTAIQMMLDEPHEVILAVQCTKEELLTWTSENY